MGAKQKIGIIGGGPAAMILACFIDTERYDVTIYEKNNVLGRKFLVAGNGGFNLTHSESLDYFKNKYVPIEFLEKHLQQFSNTHLMTWLESLGIKTFIGSSKRVFPIKGIKPIEVLNAIKEKIRLNHVTICFNHHWKKWHNNDLEFLVNNETHIIKTDITIFALGGSSWKVTGSDGLWTTSFKEKNIELNPFYPSNCAYQIQWDSHFINKHEGSALKNCVFTCGDVTIKGEAVLTQFGIEGSGIYPLSKNIRAELLNHQLYNQAQLYIDFKPDLSKEEITQRFANKGNTSIKTWLEKKINLTTTQINLLKFLTSKEDYQNGEILIQFIKRYPLTLINTAPIDAAISTVGGIGLEELTENFELKKLPNTFCIGEMLDWDAPTGGYLLQGCFTMGVSLARYLNQKAKL